MVSSVRLPGNQLWPFHIFLKPLHETGAERFKSRFVFSHSFPDSGVRFVWKAFAVQPQAGCVIMLLESGLKTPILSFIAIRSGTICRPAKFVIVTLLLFVQDGRGTLHYAGKIFGCITSAFYSQLDGFGLLTVILYACSAAPLTTHSLVFAIITVIPINR